MWLASNCSPRIYLTTVWTDRSTHTKARGHFLPLLQFCLVPCLVWPNVSFLGTGVRSHQRRTLKPSEACEGILLEGKIPGTAGIMHSSAAQWF